MWNEMLDTQTISDVLGQTVSTGCFRPSVRVARIGIDWFHGEDQFDWIEQSGRAVRKRVIPCSLMPVCVSTSCLKELILDSVATAASVSAVSLQFKLVRFSIFMMLATSASLMPD